MPKPRIRLDKNGKKRYQMQFEAYRGGKRFYKSKTFKSIREANDWYRKMLYKTDTGIITPELLKKRTVSHAIDRYISIILPHKQKNARNVIQHLKWWKERIGHIQLSEISPAIIAEFRDILLTKPGLKKKVRSKNTVLRYLASISVVFESCIKEWHWLRQNPVRSIKKPTPSKGRTRFFTTEEIARLKKACKQSSSTFLYPIFAIAIGTGMRRGEILSLRWENIDFKNKEIKLDETKNGEPRDIPMTKEVFEIISKLSGKKTISFNGLLFPSPNNGNRPIDIRSAWETALSVAEIKNATFHTARHSVATFLARIGTHPTVISRILGHKDSRTTDRYTHAIKEHLHEALQSAEVKINEH